MVAWGGVARGVARGVIKRLGLGLGFLGLGLGLGLGFRVRATRTSKRAVMKRVISENFQVLPLQYFLGVGPCGMLASGSWCVSGLGSGFGLGLGFGFGLGLGLGFGLGLGLGSGLLLLGHLGCGLGRCLFCRV